MNDENITLGAIAILTLILSSVSMITSIMGLSNNDISITLNTIRSTMVAMIIFMFISLGLMVLLECRMNTRAKKIVYCDFALKVIEDIIEKKEKACGGQDFNLEL